MPALSIIVLTIVGVAVIAGIVYLIAMRGKGNYPFSMGVPVVGNEHKGEDVWYGPRAAGLWTRPLEETFNPTAEEQTRETVRRETTEYRDDLTDPRNPRHAQWEEREDARAERAGPGEAEPPTTPGVPTPS